MAETLTKAIMPASHTPVPRAIILFICDDLGYGDLSCYGGRISTPNIDAIAGRGVRFTDFHSSGAVCSPTRASLLTGVYPQRCGILDVVSAANHRHAGLDAERWTTLPKLLKERGYATALSGKWHLGYEARFGPCRHGFDEFHGYLSGNVDYFSHLDQTGVPDWWMDEKIADEPGYTTHLITGHAIDFIRRHREVPFFLMVAHAAPHYPYQGPGDAAERMAGGACPVHGRRQNDPGVYQEMIAALDEGIGKVMSELDRLGLADEALVLFTSDHGCPSIQGSNEPMRGFKGGLEEGGLRVPLLLSWPGALPAGLVTDRTAATFDVFETIRSAAGAPSPQHPVDGSDLLPAILDLQPTLDRTLFWEHRGNLAARNGRWKLLVEKGGSTQLYDLSCDLAENHDLSQMQHALAETLRRRTEAWLAEVHPQFHP